MTVTRSQVNSAGKILRRWMTTNELAFDPRIEAAYSVLQAFRAAHSRPLIKANNGLRSMVRTEECAVEVSQRLKRSATILDKLTRHPAMALATMQDIGGCRAILANIDEVRRVCRRIAQNRPPERVDDYIENPRNSGYRALHVVVKYDDRCIEIQLRTRLMHEWAVAVEWLGGRLSADLKSSRGPQPVLDWLAIIAEARALEDERGTVSPELLARIAAARAEALQFLPGAHV